MFCGSKFSFKFENNCQTFVNGTTIVAFFRNELFTDKIVLYNNLALYSKDLKALLFVISASELVASSLE